MKICLCGSTRFMDQFHSANVALSLAGHIVYSVATSTKGDFQPTVDQKLALDMVHLRKIDESEAIMVVGKQADGSTYIGESTRREMMYARLKDKPVYFWSLGDESDTDGPATAFEHDIKHAAETTAQREAREAQELTRRREHFEKMVAGGSGVVIDVKDSPTEVVGEQAN
jgi:hypothetical protein